MRCKSLLLTTLFLSLGATAQESGIESVNLEDLLNIEVTTATKKAQRLEESPGSISVITRKQIQDTNARTMRDVLNIFVPGMDVVPTYFRYGDRVSEGVYSRGLLSDFSQQVLFLLNGQGKFNEPTFSSAYPAVEFTLENVERIEISRTPIPLYGGSAITTINIITREQNIKSGAEFFADVYAQDSANFKTQPVQGRRVSANFGKPITEYWRMSGSVQTYSDGGQEHPESAGTGGFALDPSTLRDGTKSAMNTSMVVQSEDKKWFIQTNYKEINRDAFLSGAVPSQSFDIYNYRGAHFLANLKYVPMENMEVLVGGMRTQFENVIDFLGTPYGGEIKDYDLYAETNYNLKFDAAGSHSWLNGVKVENEGQHDATIYLWNGANGWTNSKDETLIYAPNTDRTIISVYSEDTWSLSPDMNLVLGARYDRHNGFGDANYDLVNPRIATAYKMSDNSTFKATYASASRPPSIYEKLGTALTPLYGNSSIEPESVQTLELSYLYKDSQMKLQVTPFYQTFKDKIEFADAAADLNGNSNFADDLQATNNGDAKVTGVDFDAQYFFTRDSYFFFNASFVDSQDEITDKQTAFLPQVYVNGGANMKMGDSWSANINGFYRGERELPASFVVSKKHVKEHVNANLSINYNIKNEANVYVLIENVGGSENYVPMVYDGMFVPLRDRTYHVGFKWTL